MAQLDGMSKYTGGYGIIGRGSCNALLAVDHQLGGGDG
jgi:hypothetical protein